MKLSAEERYLYAVRGPKRVYAWAYWRWLQGGKVGPQPERPAGVGFSMAQCVRLRLGGW